MFITTIANSAVYWTTRPLIRAGPLIWISGVLGNTVDILYAFISKPFVNSQKEVDRLVDEALRSGGGGGEVAIVTGANSGIGYETAKAIGRAGYHTVLACRNPSLGEEAVNKLMTETGNNNFELMSLDLASFASIRSFVKDFKERHQTLNILVNNAGVFMCPYMTTEDGIEMQFGTNHVGHFLLTTELLDAIEKSGPARIINVSSIASYANARFDKAMVEDKSAYSRLFAYCNSKLSNVMFTAALARKLVGTEVTANSVYPGLSATNLFVHMGLWQVVQKVLLLNPTHGALTSIYLALSTKVSQMSGEYFVRGQPTHMHPSARSIEEQNELWEYTEDLIAKHSEQTSYDTF